MGSRVVLLGIAVFALVAAVALLVSLLWWRERFVATRLTLTARLVVFVACPLWVYLSLTVSTYVPPNALNQPAPLPESMRVYIPTWSQSGGEGNTLLAVDGRTGAVVWRSTLPTIPKVYFPLTWPPAAANGMLYLAQVTTWQIEPPADVRSAIYALRAGDGTLLRTYTLDGAIDWLGASPGGQAPGVLHFRTGKVPSLPITFGALDPASGHVLWRQATLTDPLSTPIDLVAGQHALYAHLFDDSTGANTLMALSPRTGAPLWRTPVDVPTYLDLLTDGERVYALNTNGHVIAVRARDGRALWHTYFGGSATSLNLVVHDFALADGSLYLAAQLPGTVGDAHGHLINPEAVYALDSATGALRWTYRTASGDRGTLAAGGDAVYLRADDGLHAIRATDGARLWLQADFETQGYTWGGGESGLAGPLWDAYLEAAGSVVFDARFDAIPASADHPGGCYAPCRVREDLYALDASTGVAYWRVPIGPAQDVVPHL